MRFDKSSAASDSHTVERTVDEEEGNEEEHQRQHIGDGCTLISGQCDRQLDCQQTEEGGELDDRVQSNRRSVLEGVADGVADYGGVVQWSSLLLHFNFDDLLSIVPGSAGVGHENCLVKAEDSDGNEVADEEERFDEGKSQRTEEDGDKDIQHAFLRILGADLYNFLAVGDRGFHHTIEFDVGFDELDGAVSPGGHG